MFNFECYEEIKAIITLNSQSFETKLCAVAVNG